MRIRSQLIAAAAAGTVLTALLLAGLLQVTRDSAAGLRQQSDSQEVARDVANLLTLSNEFAFYASERSAAQWRLRHRQLLATTEGALQREPEPPPALLELRRAIETLPSLFDRLVQLAGEPPTPLSQRRKELLLERLLAETQEVVEARYRWAEALGERQARDQRLYTLMVLAAPALLLLMLVALGLMVARRVLVPLARMQSAVTAMQGGDLGVRCDSTADDELGDAARAVDAMAQALQKRDAALRDSEGRLRLVMDNVPALIGYVDRQRRYAFVNQAYRAWHGPEHEVVGAAVADFYDPATCAQLAPQFDRAFAGERVQFELDVERGGRQQAMAVTFVPQLDGQGRVQGVYTMKSNVSELRRAERRLRAVMEASPLGMFLAEPSGQCLYVNPAWLRIAGLTREASLGGGWRRAVHPADRKAVDVAWATLLGSSTVQISEHRYLRPDGSVVWVRGHAVALREAGHEAGVVGIVEDITERRRLDESLVERSEALSRSNDELEQFAYVASHDLQEPLRMVTSYGQLLARRHGERLDGEAREFLDFIVDGGRRAQALVGDLLGLARVSSQAQPFEPVALAVVLAQAMRGLRLAVDESGAVVTHDEPLPTVYGDRRQLVQLLHNLLANALKFRGDAPPRVHVGACREDGRWRIRVSDNGIGIAPQYHARVFVMFQRLHPRAAYGGTGIGLAICKKVVERHGGRVGIESAPGQGSTFWFTLPDEAGPVGAP